MDTYYWTLSCSIWTWFVSPFVLSVLQKFSMLLRAHVKLCLTELDFLVKFLYSKKWSKWLRNGSFQLFEKSCHQFSLKMFSKCFQYPPVQTRCLGKFLFLSLGTNYSQPIRLQDSLEEYLLIDWLDFSDFSVATCFTWLQAVRRGKYLDQFFS